MASACGVVRIDGCGSEPWVWLVSEGQWVWPVSVE